uniref:Uncharacterized protein n=1 Tax=Avena sativa TaxID=4498 RepID=A0ACD5TXX7_AVESA
MNEARELSYDMEEAIDEFVHQNISQFPSEELKTRVKYVSERSSEMRKTDEVISSSSKPAIVDPRARFLHRDESELVGIEELKNDLVELVVCGADIWGDTLRRRHATNNRCTKQRMVIKVAMGCDKLRRKAIAIVVNTAGVSSVVITGSEQDDMLEVVGDGVDPVRLTSTLRRKVGSAQLVSIGSLKKYMPVVEGYRRSDQINTVCIHGLPGVGKTALADLVYRATEKQFDYRAFVSVSPTPNIMEILRTILKEVTNSSYDFTETATEQCLVHEISKFLEDKRYLIIIDDIWNWTELEIIMKSLPKNYPNSRIIITTRISAIAERCRTDDNHAFLYEIERLDTVDAWQLMKYVCVTEYIEDYPWHCIPELCDGMPLAIICLSSALKDQIQDIDSESEKTRALWCVKDGILTIPSMKPLADSLYLGYNDLPLYLRTFLLYCSIYNWRYKFEKERLVGRWFAERFVYDKGTAEGCFEDLVNRAWIKPAANGKYEIHPVILAFLKCKSQEDNFVTHLDFGYINFLSKQIPRLSLHLKEGQSVDFSSLDLSHTRSLAVFGSVSAVPFKQFERLRVLELENTGDLGNAHLLDICGLLWLRHLGLMGTPITEVPPQIKRLLHLETLDIRDTGVMELPWEACRLPKSVRVLAGSKDSQQVIELPEDTYECLKKGIPDSSLKKCREVLSILLYDPSRPGRAAPQFAIFKVPGLSMEIPELIKEYFKVLSSLDIRLCKLSDDDLKFLQEMPHLKNLLVRFEVVPVKPVSIGAAGFAMLENFFVDSRVPRVTFGPGAMPKLKCLVFKFYAGPESKNPVGITHLQRLQVVAFWCSPWYRSDSLGISATIAVIREEAREHPNSIIFHINGKVEIFPGNKGEQACEEAGSSGTCGVVEARAGTDAIPSCSQTSEIEEIDAQWYSGRQY